MPQTWNFENPAPFALAGCEEEALRLLFEG